MENTASQNTENPLYIQWYYIQPFNHAPRVIVLRRNPPDVGVTSGQKPCTKIIYIVLQTSVGLF